MLRYPLLDKFNPQCPQDLKCSLIVDACARTISAWIAAAILLPSSSDRPSVSGPPNPPFLFEPPRSRSLVRLSRPQVSPAKPASPQRRLLPKARSLAFKNLQAPTTLHAPAAARRDLALPSKGNFDRFLRGKRWRVNCPAVPPLKAVGEARSSRLQDSDRCAARRSHHQGGAR